MACFWTQRALADCPTAEDPLPRMTFGAPHLTVQLRQLLLVELYENRGEAAHPDQVFETVSIRGRS